MKRCTSGSSSRIPSISSRSPLPLVAPLSQEPSMPPCSAFARYERPDCLSSRISNETKNIHCRVIELLRRIPRARSQTKAGEYIQGFRHMTRERQRRERLSQSYADLHSMLPYSSKPDKNSVVQSATAYVRELEEELKKRRARKSNSEGPEIKIRVVNPSSTIDSMIGALQCFIMSIESKVGACEVERALMESWR